MLYRTPKAALRRSSVSLSTRCHMMICFYILFLEFQCSRSVFADGSVHAPIDCAHRRPHPGPHRNCQQVDGKGKGRGVRKKWRGGGGERQKKREKQRLENFFNWVLTIYYCFYSLLHSGYNGPWLVLASNNKQKAREENRTN